MEPRGRSILESLLWLWDTEQALELGIAVVVVAGGAIFFTAEALGAPRWAAFASIGAVPAVSWAAVYLNNQSSRPTSLGLSNNDSKN